MRSLRLAAIAIAVGLSASGAAAVGAEKPKLVVIVNAANPVTALSKQSLKELFLGQHHTWAGGTAVKLVEVRDTAALDVAYLVLTGRNYAAVRQVWVRLIFAGDMPPPLVVGTFAEARDLVARERGAIAVVEQGVVNEGVKAVFELPP